MAVAGAEVQPRVAEKTKTKAEKYLEKLVENRKSAIGDGVRSVGGPACKGLLTVTMLTQRTNHPFAADMIKARFGELQSRSQLSATILLDRFKDNASRPILATTAAHEKEYAKKEWLDLAFLLAVKDCILWMGSDSSQWDKSHFEATVNGLVK
jgi:hypothetical protein